MNLEIDLGLDSLARAEVIAALEQAFETEFTAEQAAATLTVRDAVNLVSSTDVGRSLTAESGDALVPTADLNWSKIVRTADGLPEMEAVTKRRPLFEAFSFSVMKSFGFLFCKPFMRLEVSGQENLKAVAFAEDGKVQPFLICPNHQSFLDPFVLCSTYPWAVFRNFFHVGAKMFFEGRFLGLLQNAPCRSDRPRYN